jgi:hypothetical protein
MNDKEEIIGVIPTPGWAREGRRVEAILPNLTGRILPSSPTPNTD